MTSRDEATGTPGAPSGFELLDHTADVGVRAWGRDVPELFAAAALGLFTVIADPGTVRPARSHRIALDAGSLPELLHAWLDHLNSLHQVEREIFSEFDIRLAGTRLEAFVRGERMDPARHDLRTEVKAVTWHGLDVQVTSAGWEARVLLDI